MSSTPESLRDSGRLIASVAYIYLGIAVRLCLSAGFNRFKVGVSHESCESREISRTWW
jgi:hypothetical protein